MLPPVAANLAQMSGVDHGSCADFENSLQPVNGAKCAAVKVRLLIEGSL